jgi:hypothetical protein
LHDAEHPTSEVFGAAIRPFILGGVSSGELPSPFSNRRYRILRIVLDNILDSHCFSRPWRPCKYSSQNS